MKIEVFYTGGGIWLAEMNLEDGTYAAISSDYPEAMCIYKHVEDEEPYMSENMIFCDEVQNFNNDQLKIHT